MVDTDNYASHSDDYSPATTMVDDENNADVDYHAAPKVSASRDTKTSTTSYYGLLALLPLFLIAVAGAAYYVYYR